MAKATPTKKQIDIDSAEIRKQIIISAIVVLVLCIIVTILFTSLFNYSNRIETITLMVLWITMPLLWAAGSLAAWLKINKNSYILTDDSLVVKKSGLGGVSETYYRFDSFLAIEARQGLLSKDSGKIVINIPKMATPLVLDYIKNPADQAEELKRLVVKDSPNSKSLIN